MLLFEEGVRTGDIRPVRSEPYNFFGTLAGTILFYVYVAALTHFVAELPEDHLSTERMETLESGAVAERLLGRSGRRSV